MSNSLGSDGFGSISSNLIAASLAHIVCACEGVGALMLGADLYGRPSKATIAAAVANARDNVVSSDPVLST